MDQWNYIFNAYILLKVHCGKNNGVLRDVGSCTIWFGFGVVDKCQDLALM